MLNKKISKIILIVFLIVFTLSISQVFAANNVIVIERNTSSTNNTNTNKSTTTTVGISNNTTNNNTNTNTNTNNNTNTNTNKVKTYNTTNTSLPSTGIEDYSLPLIIAICLVSAVYTFMKIRDYRNIE